MGTLQKSITSTLYHLYNSLTSPKLWTAGILLFAAVYRLVVPFAKIAKDYKADVNIGFISCFFFNSFTVTLIYMALLFIFSELPFNSPQQIYLMSRCGKRSWCISQLLYIILISVIVMLAISLLTIIILAGHLSFDNSWGKFILKGANGGLYKYGVVGIIRYEAHTAFSPYAALAWSLPVGTLTMIAFGSVVFSLNSLFRSSVGTVAGAVIIALTLIGRFLGVAGSRYLMIIDWSDFSAVNIYRAPKTPTPVFEICVLAIMFIISVILIIFCSRKRSDIKT